jgi:hypothetical protein
MAADEELHARFCFVADHEKGLFNAWRVTLEERGVVVHHR